MEPEKKALRRVPRKAFIELAPRVGFEPTT